MATKLPLVNADGIVSELPAGVQIPSTAVAGFAELSSLVSQMAAKASYTHVQNSAATEWVVTHNLGRYAAVTVVDSSLREVVGAVEHISVDQCVLTFSAPFAGKAFLS